MDTTAEPDSPPARRARWGRRFVLGLVVVAVLVALAPLGSGPVLRALVVKGLEDELDARARVQTVSFAWPAKLRLRGLELSDASGAPLAALDELRADLELWPLLRGELHGRVELDYPELHLSRTRDGRWNWEHVLRPAESNEEESREKAREGTVPDVRLGLRVADGHVLVHGPEGDTVLGDIAVAVDVDGLDRPAPLHLSLGVRGPLGPAGRVSLEGSFSAAGGRLDVLSLAGEARLALEELDLAAFAPALALVSPVSGLGGMVNGKVELSLGAGLAFAGKSAIEVRDLTLRGPRPGAGLGRIARLGLHGEATQHGEGAGDQHLELTADSFLSLAYDGRSSAPSRGAGTLAGTLDLTADLAQASELARGWVPLQPGVALAGRIQGKAELGATLADRRPASASARLRAGIEGLAARDPSGRALDLSQLAGLALELDAAADLEHGTLGVPAFAVRSGPVTCTGRLEAAGLAASDAPEGFELRSGAFELEADLEELRGTLAQVVELEGVPFGGHLSASGTLSGEGGSPDHLEARLEGRGLTFAGTSLADLRCQTNARRGADRALSGSAEATFGRIGLALEGGSALELPGARLELTLSEDAVGRGAHTLALVTSDSALSLDLKGTNQRGDGELALATTLAMRGRVANLAALAASFAPIQPGLEGSLRAEGELNARLAGGTLASAGGKLRLQLADLTARDAGGKPRRLGALEQASLALAGELDARAGRAELSSLELATGGLELSGSGRVLGIADEPELEEGKVTLSADLARLGPELANVVDLAGWSLSGSPLTAELRLSTQDQRIEAAGKLAALSVQLERAPSRPLVVRDVDVDFDLGYDRVLGSLHVRNATARSSTAEVRLAGTLNELLAPARAHGAMQLEIEGELARILGDLGLENEASGRKTSGKLGVELALEGDGGAFRVTGKSRVEDFRLELAPAAPGEAPLVIEEPRITLDCAARVTLEHLDVELSKLTLESGHTRGGAEGRIENLRALAPGGTDAGEVRFVGLKGQLAYIPDRLGAVLAPLLPGKLSGAEEQRANFTLDGHARDFDLAKLLASSQARVDLGIGRFELPEGQIDGALVMETKDERLFVRGDLGANGGSLQVDGELDLAQEDESPRSKLSLTAKGVRANAKMAPWLARLHPAFAASGLAQGSLDGLITLGLDLSYDAPLTPDALAAGWEALPKEPIHGTGRLEIASLALRGSPFLALLGRFGVDAEKTLDLRPIDFTIEKGRVTYAKPWVWSFAGTETTFTGSIGLDESLDLAWNVPITDKLVGRWSFLAALEGERLSIPVRGTVRAPRLEADELLADLAGKAAQREFEGRLGLGKASGEDPSALLQRADALWSQGKKADAAALYMRLREEFKLSLAYALNKDRIRDRSKYTEPPK